MAFRRNTKSPELPGDVSVHTHVRPSLWIICETIKDHRISSGTASPNLNSSYGVLDCVGVAVLFANREKLRGSFCRGAVFEVCNKYM